MKEVKTVYIAEKITGDPNYRKKFERAQRKLEAAGFIVMNPATLPDGEFSYDTYMRLSSEKLDASDAVYFLPDWKDSRGAMFEFGRTVTTGKQIINSVEVVEEANE